MKHRDKAQLFTENSRTAAKFMQPSTPPHHGMDSRRTAAVGTVAAANGGTSTPYGKGYAKNASRGSLIPMTPGEPGSHPIPAHPKHPRGKPAKNPIRGGK